jgi:sec-independent protein translocase protein TatB
VFNVGTPELLVILLVALIVLGPNKLPDAARQVGRFMGEFRRMSSGFQNELRDAMQEPVSGNGDGRRSDPVPKATPADKPVSAVIDDQGVVAEPAAAEASSAPPAAAADPSSASPVVAVDASFASSAAAADPSSASPGAAPVVANAERTGSDDGPRAAATDDAG